MPISRTLIPIALSALMSHCATARTRGRTTPARHVCEVADGRPSAMQVATARYRFDQGVQFAALGRYGEALDAFRAAQQVADHPVASLNIARALWALRRYDEVVAQIEHYRTIADLTSDDALNAQAMSLLVRARQQTGTLRLQLSHSEARVRVDRVERPVSSGPDLELTLNAGPHVIEVLPAGAAAMRFRLTVRPGGRLVWVVQATPRNENTPTGRGRGAQR